MDSKKLRYGDTSVKLKITSYESDPVCMALTLESEEDPCAVLTVNIGSDIGNGTIMPRCCGFVDVNNYPDAVRFIEENGLGEPYTRFGMPVKAYGTFTEYPLYQFDVQRLKELDEEGFAEYESGYQDAFQRHQQEMFGSMLDGFAGMM